MIHRWLPSLSRSPSSVIPPVSLVPSPLFASSTLARRRAFAVSTAAAAMASGSGVATSALHSGHVALAFVSHGARHDVWNTCPHCCNAMARSPHFNRAWHTGHSSASNAVSQPSSRTSAPGTAAMASSLSTLLPLSSEPRFAAARRAARSAAIRLVCAFALFRLSSLNLRLASCSAFMPPSRHAAAPTRSALSTGVSSR